MEGIKINEYLKSFKVMEVASKTTLIHEGEVSKKVYWIEKGCIRVWFNQEGKDITFQFFTENSVVASLESFRKGIPSYVTVETIEPCVLWVAEKKDIDRIVAEVTADKLLREKYIDAIFERTFDYMKHFFSIIKDTPQQRYQKLIKERPELIKRVPQHYLASYLGISSVHLSRIKSKLAKE